MSPVLQENNIHFAINSITSPDSGLTKSESFYSTKRMQKFRSISMRRVFSIVLSVTSLGLSCYLTLF